MTVEEIKKLAEKAWEGCHGCDENDKNFWVNGFVMGYLNAEVKNIENKIEKHREKISDLLINFNTL
jgi:hypothetical protein